MDDSSCVCVWNNNKNRFDTMRDNGSQEKN